MPRIYLDNAATSWPKPESVYLAVDDYQRSCGASAGRSGHGSSLIADRIGQQARQGVARIIGAREASQIAFTLNGTASLNLAIHGLLRPGDHVVTTVCDHNSVLRPLRFAERELGCRISYTPCDGEGIVSPDDVVSLLEPETRLVAVVHGSNVTGAIQPIDEIADRVRDHPALLLVDAAQTVGHTSLDVAKWGIDLLAAPGHKGMLGPLGTGFLYLRPGVEAIVAPTVQGGTGSQSELEEQPESLPDRYESGNHNTAGLAGLGAAIAFLEEEGIAAIGQRIASVTTRLVEGLSDLPGCRVYGPSNPTHRVGVVSATLEGYDPQELVAALEATSGIECRAGLHCAPRMHQAMGTADVGGTVRFSPGHTSADDEIDVVLHAMGELAAAVKV